MNTTFYGVLGVGPDADDDAIRDAYRERVKEHHPDVSTAPDAVERFKRLTAAKEALLDPKERQRYDRLGHASYVDAYGDPSLWELDRSSETDESSSERDEPSSETVGSSGTDSAADAESTSRQAAAGTRSPSSKSRSKTTGSQSDSSRARSTSTGPRSTSTASRSRSTGTKSGSTGTKSGSTDTKSGATDRGTSTTSTDRSRDSRTQTGTGTGSTRGSAGWSARRNRTRGEATSTSKQSARTGSASTATGGSHARGSFWDVADSDVSDAGRADPLLARAVGLLRTLGAWVLVHLLFLALAAGTGWYVYAVVVPPAHRSLALLLVVLGEVGLALVLSSLHVLSRVYR